MNDLDARLAKHFARVRPPPDFDARLAVRLGQAREHDSRQDRAAARSAALAQHALARRAATRDWRRAAWRTVGCGIAATTGVALTLPAWRELGAALAGVATGVHDDPRGLAAIALLTIATLVAGLRRRRPVAWPSVAR